MAWRGAARRGALDTTMAAGPSAALRASLMPLLLTSDTGPTCARGGQRGPAGGWGKRGEGEEAAGGSSGDRAALRLPGGAQTRPSLRTGQAPDAGGDRAARPPRNKPASARCPTVARLRNTCGGGACVRRGGAVWCGRFSVALARHLSYPLPPKHPNFNKCTYTYWHTQPQTHTAHLSVHERHVDGPRCGGVHRERQRLARVLGGGAWRGVGGGRVGAGWAPAWGWLRCGPLPGTASRRGAAA
jgi:hypothetical protein